MATKKEKSLQEVNSKNSEVSESITEQTKSKNKVSFRNILILLLVLLLIIGGAFAGLIVVKRIRLAKHQQELADFEKNIKSYQENKKTDDEKNKTESSSQTSQNNSSSQNNSVSQEGEANNENPAEQELTQEECEAEMTRQLDAERASFHEAANANTAWADEQRAKVDFFYNNEVIDQQRRDQLYAEISETYNSRWDTLSTEHTAANNRIYSMCGF